jgi:hypothetical protein
MVLARKAAQAAALAIRDQDISSGEEEAEEDNRAGSTRSHNGALRQTPRPKQTYGKGKKRARDSTGGVHTKRSPESRSRKSMDNNITTSPRTPFKRERSESPPLSESISIAYTPLRSSASLRDIMDDLLSKTASVLTHPTTPHDGTSPSAPSASLLSVPDEWSLGGLGSYVWVRIHQEGEVFEEEQDVETYWWPAKVYLQHHVFFSAY